MERALESLETAGGIEILRVDASGVVRGAVIAGEDDDCVIGDAGLLERGEDATDFLVEARDHRGVGRARRAVGHVAAFGRDVRGGFGDHAIILLQLFGWHLEGDVGQGGGVVEEKRLVLVRGDERFGAGDGVVAREILADIRRERLGILRVGVGREVRMARHAGRSVIERDLLSVVLDERRVVAVGDPLAGNPKEMVEALLHRIAGGLEAAHAPFAESAGRIAGLLERRGQRRDAGRERELFLAADILVVTGRGVARVTSGH